MGLCYNDWHNINRFNLSRNKGDKLMEFIMFMFNIVVVVLIGSFLFNLIERYIEND